MQQAGEPANNASQRASEDKFRLSAPQISLPKGGGAIRGMGEKFAANPVTGTGSLSVPLAVSPGRSGFGPQLSLSYDSGGGNGPFGFGWNLALANISRKTDKGLPLYQDALDSDVFMLAGVEDLVPMFRRDRTRDSPDAFVVTDGKLEIHEDRRTVDGQVYVVRRYRPRIEGLFARIDRWSNVANAAEVFWRSISRDNVTSWYGKTGDSRIADPADASRVFSWLICESYDDKGNVIAYEYKEEDAANAPVGANERNRSRTANRYPKHIRYGNRTPYLPKLEEDAQWPAPLADQFFFEVVFDYGEHDADNPLPDDPSPWPARNDPFSSYRAGFEVRTYRLCQRVLMFHHFDGKPGVGLNCLVRSTDFTYGHEQDPTDARNPVYSFLRSVTQTAYQRNAAAGDPYLSRSLPPLELTYTVPEVDDEVREIVGGTDNLPYGLDGTHYQWIDLEGEGVSGILSEQGGSWFYKRNLSPVELAADANGIERAQAKFAPVELVSSKPNARIGSAEARFLDLAGDGQPDLVVLDGPTPGFYEYDADAGWQRFRAFIARLNRSTQDPNLRFVDLDGDGHADVLITEDDVLTWHRSLAEEGFAPAERIPRERDEERGPALVLADAAQSIYLADMSGDGLTDLVRIRNGEICYWPNLGYGRFGPKVTMDNAPWFDADDLFDQRRLLLADIDGSGTTDLIYLHGDGPRLYFNQSGNGWGEARALAAFPRIDDVSTVIACDLLGNGTACLVWSSPLPGAARRPMRYVDLMGGRKPHLLIGTTNNLGASTELKYAPSTKFYLADKLAGKPWVTRLPFPVHVVEAVTVVDRWRGTRFTTTYSYHHGYFDGFEREFRGFGRVEQVDTEDYGRFRAGNVASPYVTDDRRLFQPPVKTVSWFHTGVFADAGRVLSLYESEYFPQRYALAGFREKTLADPDFADANLTTDEWREALRACKGLPLRQETYELDVDALRAGRHEPVKLFSAACHSCHVDRLQPRERNRHAVFLVTESEAITYNYELDLRVAPVEPDPRVSHTLNLRIDDLGNVLQAVTIGYPRFRRFEDPEQQVQPADVSLIRDVQKELHLAYSERRFTETDIDSADGYRLRMPCEAQIYELTGLRNANPADDPYFSIERLRAYRLSERYQSVGIALESLAYHEQPERVLVTAPPQKRIVEHTRTRYFDDASDVVPPTDALPLGEHGPRGLKYEDCRLALTADLLTGVFGARLDEIVLPGKTARALLNSAQSGFLREADEYWQRSGIAGFGPQATEHFFLPHRYIDPFDAETLVNFDVDDLFITSVEDALGNVTSVLDFNYRTLTPAATRDVNDNVVSTAVDILGMPVAMATQAAADTLAGFDVNLLNPAVAELAEFFTLDPYSEQRPREWLGSATGRYLYHFGEQVDGNGVITGWQARPPASGSIQRQTHVGRLAPGSETDILVAVEYSDGGGNVLVRKAQAEPDPESQLAEPPLRWIASGKTIVNNKGKPVKQFEPYFSDTEHRFDETEAQREVGVTPVMYYDAPGRLIRTEMPDGTFSKVEFTPWQLVTFDQADTLTASLWIRERLTAAERGVPLLAANATEAEKTQARAAEAAAALATATNKHAARLSTNHADTPLHSHLDSLGREAVAVAHNRTPDANGVWRDEIHVTYTKLDAEGKGLWIRDPRGNLVTQYLTPAKANDDPSNLVDSAAVFGYDIAGNVLYQHSMDAGDRWSLNDAAGKPLVAWDVNDRGAGTPSEPRIFHHEYDPLQRPIRQWLKLGTANASLIEAFDYCDVSAPNAATDVADAKERNLVRQTVRHFDPSGLATLERVDVCGKPGHVTRTLIKPDAGGLSGVVDWSTANRAGLLDEETFRQITEYDALARMTLSYGWHRDVTIGANGDELVTPGATNRVAVYEPTYNERGRLASESLHVRARKFVDQLGLTRFTRDAQRSQQAVKRIDYDEKGQKLRLDLGNGTITRYRYDPKTSRLTEIVTRRGGADLQRLSYTYDAVGNVTRVQDDAQQAEYFANAIIEPHNDYVYDALYRLIEATGRENAAALAPPRSRDGPWPTSGFPSNNALRRYRQSYRYDAASNFVEMVHEPAAGTGWTRHYSTQADSNRLDQTWYGVNTTVAVTYRHDAHGNILNLNRIEIPPPRATEDDWGLDLRWDWRDMLLGLDLGGGGVSRYHYGIDKQRSRKRVTRLGGVVEDRIYLGGLELYRRRDAQNRVVEAIESHHLFEGAQRMLLVDDVILAPTALNPRHDALSVAAQTLFRYQYGNHLGSSCVELDAAAALISYEEYHPHGTTAYRMSTSDLEVPPKRYGYTGMERDEESGLNYHAARFLLPWLARWACPDPIGVSGGPNLYLYANSNPTRYLDPLGKQGVASLLKREEKEFTKAYQNKNLPFLTRQLAGDFAQASDILGTVWSGFDYLSGGTIESIDTIHDKEESGDPRYSGAYGTANYATDLSGEIGLFGAKSAAQLFAGRFAGKLIPAAPPGSSALMRLMVGGEKAGAGALFKVLINRGADSLLGRGDFSLSGTALSVGKSTATSMGLSLLGELFGVAFPGSGNVTQLDPATGEFGDAPEPSPATPSTATSINATPLTADASGYTPTGGAYRAIRDAWKGGEVNHMPSSWAVSFSSLNLTRDNAPAILMDVKDHVQTGNWGSWNSSIMARFFELEWIGDADFALAQDSAIQEIQEMFGSKYDDAIREMLTYSRLMGFRP